MSSDKPTVTELAARLKARQDRLVAWLKTTDGKEGLSFLETKYGRDVVERDPYATHIRIGERRVIDYLKELRESENV